MKQRTSSTLRLFASLTPEERETALLETARKSNLTVPQLKARLLTDWRVVGRPKQQAPPGLWFLWLIVAGRGFGKTITGAQWTKGKIKQHPGARGALVAPTLSDVRSTMVEGETGLLSILPDTMLRGGSRETAWNRGSCELYLENSVKLQGFSSETPERLRGPQHHFLWGDEVSSWNDAKDGDKLETTYSNAKLGLRLGEYPQMCLTTTPKPNKLTKELLAIADGSVAVSRGSSYENRDNLSEAWWKTVVQPYEGTRLGAQEILAQVLEDVEGALWRLAQIEALRVKKAPDLERIVVAVDPNASSDAAANEAGIIVSGRATEGGVRKAYVLADETVAGGPRAWAKAAVEAYHGWSADRIVAEKNNGGEMVEITIHTVDANVPVKLVTASRGKRPRAEPVSSLYEGDPEKGNPPRVHHVGSFPELEEQMTTWTPDMESPDRMDALVWGLTELLLGPTRTMHSTVPKGRIPGVTERVLRQQITG